MTTGAPQKFFATRPLLNLAIFIAVYCAFTYGSLSGSFLLAFEVGPILSSSSTTRSPGKFFQMPPSLMDIGPKKVHNEAKPLALSNWGNSLTASLSSDFFCRAAEKPCELWTSLSCGRGVGHQQRSTHAAAVHGFDICFPWSSKTTWHCIGLH